MRVLPGAIWNVSYTRVTMSGSRLTGVILIAALAVVASIELTSRSV